MTTPNYRSPTAESDSDPGTKEKAQQTAGTAADEGKHVAGVAADEAKQVTAEAKRQARNLVGEAKTQLEEQSRSQRDRLVSTLRTFSDDLEQMSAQRDGGTASALVHQGAEKVRDLTDTLAGREPGELLDEVRSFARRKPGTFLLGALVAGVVAGRLARGAKDAGDGSEGGGAAQGDFSRMSSGTSATTRYPSPAPVSPPAAGAGNSGVSPMTQPRTSVDPGLGAQPDPLGGPGTAGQPWADDPARRGPE
jgi:hypothetical protein